MLERIPREPGRPGVLGFPGASAVDPQREVSNGVILSVQPAEGEPWIGLFERGELKAPPAAPRQVVGWPDEKSLCVVDGGAACVVDTHDPTRNFDVDCFPVCDLLAVPDRDLIVFADFVSLVAYGREGIVWKSGRVAWDDVQIVGVDGDNLAVRGYDPTGGKPYPVFTVDLRTGESADKPWWEGSRRPG